MEVYGFGQLIQYLLRLGCRRRGSMSNPEKRPYALSGNYFLKLSLTMPPRFLLKIIKQPTPSLSVVMAVIIFVRNHVLVLVGYRKP